jgi:hypothetical protein
MPEATRREFLKRAGAGMAGVAVAPADESPAAAAAPPGLPPHLPVPVHGVHAYPAEHSVAAGDTLALHVSSSVPYRLTICRLGTAVDDPDGDEVLLRLPEQEARPLPIHLGSYVHVGNKLIGPLSALTLECWVRPWRLRAPGGVITQFDHPSTCGVGLFIRPDRSAAFYVGDGGAYRAAFDHAGPAGRVRSDSWHHLVGTWDGQTKTLWVDGRPVGSWPFAGPARPGDAPLRLAAAGRDGRADQFLDADLAMPAVYGRALTAEQIRERFRARGHGAADGPGVLACWPLEEERGDRVADRSGHGRDGRIINLATWMVGGPAFDADVPRYGDYDPAKDPRRGHGLRFAADDLYDCRWPVRHEWRVPPDARPGLYGARFQFDWDGKPRVAHVTFIVRRPATRPKAPILVLAATNTWRAYNSTPFAVAPPGFKKVWGLGGIAGGADNPPVYTLYGAHAAGQGTYQMGLRLPWPAAGPNILYGGPCDYSHLMRADRFLHAWLEQSGYAFDVVSDLDLHRDPDVLRGYQVFVITGHSEYWSVPMYRGLEAYLKAGGNVVNLSGNTLFWRVSFDESGTVMECRKVDAPGEQMRPNRRGEAWHAHDGRRGGLMRECGFPGWKLLGLETLGWNNQSNPQNFGPFVVEDPGHALFNRPEPLGLNKGDKIGQAADGKLPMANGHEFDARLSTLAALQEQPPPAGTAVPPDPPGIHRLANGIIPWQLGGAAFDYFFRPIDPKSDQGGEMVYWERPDGGRVFNAGTIGLGWALSVDPKLQGLLRNVLAHFGVPRPTK